MPVTLARAQTPGVGCIKSDDHKSTSSSIGAQNSAWTLGVTVLEDSFWLPAVFVGPYRICPKDLGPEPNITCGAPPLGAVQTWPRTCVCISQAPPGGTYTRTSTSPSHLGTVCCFLHKLMSQLLLALLEIFTQIRNSYAGRDPKLGLLQGWNVLRSKANTSQRKSRIRKQRLRCAGACIVNSCIMVQLRYFAEGYIASQSHASEADQVGCQLLSIFGRNNLPECVRAGLLPELLWMEEILHHFLGVQFIGQAAMSPHPLFNIGR